MRLWAYTFRELWRRPGRTVLTLLGIVIGVAAVVSVSVAASTAGTAFQDMFAAVGGRASLEVVAQGQGGFDGAVASSLEAVPGVKAAVPAVQEQAALLGGKGRVAVLVMGVDPARDGLVRDYVVQSGAALAAGAAPGSPPPVLMEAGFARAQGLEVGSAVRLLTRTGSTEGVVRGLLAPSGAAMFNGGAALFMPLADAQRLFDLGTTVNTIALVLTAGAEREAVRTAVERVLPPGLTVQTPSSRGDLAEMTLASTQLGLSVVSALSLVAGGFIILNAFLMSVGERRRQLALLRALGATRRQVTRLLLREALLLGGLGTSLGLLAGLGASVALTAALSALLGVHLPALKFSPRPFVLGAILGPGLSLVATYVPARRAGRVSPLEGLLGGGRESRGGGRRILPYVGLALTAVCVVAGVGLVTGKIGASFGSPLFMGMLIGCVMAIPLVVGPLSRASAWLLAPVLGVEGRLAFRQIDRHRTRTSLTVGVLFVAIVVAVSMGNSLLANVQDTADWYRRTVVGDFFVRGVMPDIGTNRAVALPEKLGAEIAALPGADRVDPLRFVPATAEGRQVIVLARPFSADRPLPMDLYKGEPKSVLGGLLRGEVVIGTGLAFRTGLGVGDMVTLQTREGPRQFRVAGTTTEYTAGGDAVYMAWDVAKRYLDFEGADVYLVSAKAGQVDTLAAGLRALAARDGFLLQTLAEFKVFIDGMINGVLGFLWLLIAMVFVVASLGIVNTLTMNVLEQTREVGLLRAVAMTRGQVRKMVVAQAVGLGVISLAPGAVVGIAIAYLLNKGSYAVSGQPVDFHVQPVLVVGSFAVALGIAVLAAYLPARRAAGLRVVEALQYE
jgi:putative ABC transport system permease protein